MIKNYKAWMRVKTQINNNPRHPHYKEGEIYWMSVGENIGVEQDGKNQLFTRPVLIVKGFSANLIWGIPLTTKNKNNAYHFPFQLNNKTSIAILSQLRAIDISRISGKRLGRIEAKTLTTIKNKLKQLL